jgi:hypothetical protein
MRKLRVSCLFTLVFFLILSGTFALSAESAMPVPTGPHYFEYPSVSSPSLSDNPALAQPIAVGSVAQGGGTFTLQIGTSSFDGPVDAYFLVYSPSYPMVYAPTVPPSPYTYGDPLASFFVMRPDKIFQPLLQAIVPWQKGITSALNETIFGNVPTFFLAQGSPYYLYLLITPAGSLGGYYLWSTPFSTYTAPVPVCNGGLPCPIK